MDQGGRVYAAIDLKSFYASVECRMRGLDPLTTNLVVADASRTEKTICLAVSPPLKAWGVSGRPRLFEVVQRVAEVNAQRKAAIGGRAFTGESYDDIALRSDPSLKLSYVVATPQMACYMQRSSEIYQVYLEYVAPEDVHVYSIDEVFIDLTPYLKLYGKSPYELVESMVKDVLARTGITATAGIGTNMYLAKVAMDIVAKHLPADSDGVRIAQLDEAGYRRKLWCHRPLTDFWRVGPGYASKLEANGLHTMGDIARCSIDDEEVLYRLFGVNAEYLIDHAWGVEPTTIADIRSYKPKAQSTGSGQVLPCPYTFDQCRVVAREMAEALSLDLVAKGLVCDQVVLTVGYDRENLEIIARGESAWRGEMGVDWYGRAIPRHAHGTANLARATASTAAIVRATEDLYDRIVDPALLIRRLFVVAGHVLDEEQAKHAPEQLTLFDPMLGDDAAADCGATGEDPDRERRRQDQIIEIKKRFGKNAILKGTNFKEGARAIERNDQIGGHRA